MSRSEYRGKTDKLRIFQINTRKSVGARDELINNLSPDDWDIVAIQEPALNKVENIQVTRHWQVFYPCTKPNDNHPKLRATTLVNARISHCVQINVASSDILAAHLDGQRPRGQRPQSIWLGDFNRHHQIWESEANSNLRSSAEKITPLLDLIVEHGMQQLLPAGIPTRIENKSETRPDNREAAKRRPNYKRTNWEKFQEGIETAIKEDRTLSLEPKTVEELEAAVDALTGHIQNHLQATTPTSRTNTFQKPWWTNKCKEAHRRKCRAYTESRRWRATPEHPSHQTYRAAQEDMKQVVRKSKEEHWWSWIENANDSDLWNINRFQKRGNSDGSRERIPPLKTNGMLTQSEEEKAAVLAEAFFPPPPSLGPVQPTRRPHQLPEWRPYTVERIRRAASHLKRDKAPGPDGIPNAAIQEALPSIKTVLTNIYNAAMRLRHIPKQWKVSTTVVLRKPGKPAYNVAKAYRPIALLNTLGKLLSALMAEDISYLCEQHQLLPKSQFGGRPGRTTTDALHLPTCEIKNAWRKGKVVSALFLDIQAAFPNVVKPILVENMREKGIPETYVQTIEDMLTGRTSRLKFDGTHSELRPIANGNSQGCPLSMILYLFYIAPLLEIANREDQRTIGFVDDTTIIAIGSSFTETHSTLKEMMERPGGVLDWSYRHNSPLEISKLALIDFTRSTNKWTESTALTLNTHNVHGVSTPAIISPSKSYKLLGVILDNQLRWNKHEELVHARAVKWTALFSRIHRTLHGLPIRMGRQLYKAVAIPRIQYAADLWYTPLHASTNETKRAGSVAVTNKLQGIQRRATIGITGALRTTAGDALDIHINLLPIEVSLGLACRKAAARLASLPNTHPLSKFVKQMWKGKVQRHNTPLHYLFHTAGIDVASMEKIDPSLKNPNLAYPFKLTIDKSRELAIERDKEISTQDVAIYTDGSGMEGMISAAAVLYRNGRRVKTVRCLLGTNTQHTVHEGELVGIALGIHLAKSIPAKVAKVNISLDNQAAIQSITHLGANAGQHVVARISSKDQLSVQRALRIEFTWVPGHEGVQGNEAADEEAKKAITEGASGLSEHPKWLRKPLPSNLSAAKQECKRLAKEEARELWSNSKQFNRMSKIDETMPSGRYLKLTDKLPRRDAALLIQLRQIHHGVRTAGKGTSRT
ncbi:SubName: Full=Uncharacterized protein {ECO:0000313/EMBL:CCA73447.1} [Serendipita indica DSM 11827]|nr:SubName: Full=Uncharacterized protein {ECO:0000313/EMBL:CCA73447.1} [Serendipita indica DSM 11827]